jgi:hypothetical protein
VCVVQKTNLGRLKPGYRFRLDPFRWLGACDLTANDISKQCSGEEPPSSLGDAVEFLSQALSSGPLPSKGIEEQAKARGISGSTFRRAKTRLGVASRKEGFSGGWLLCIEGAHEDAQGAHRFNGSSFSTFDQPNA